MRKFAIQAALATTALTLAATPALARDDSWYIGAEAGGTIISNADIDVTNSAGVFTNNAYSINTEPGFDVGGILGYDFGWFRLEADVSYRRAEVTTIEQNLGSILPIAGTVTGTSVNYNPGGPNGSPPGNPFQWNGAQGSMRILAFMANGLLDFGDDDGFQGYIGGGVGIARTSFDGIRVTDAAPVITDDSDSGFAWQLVAGVRYPLSRNFDIGVKYRFFNQDNVGTNSFYSTSDETDVRSHSALVTLTYNFGSPPPPPVAPPPPPVVTPPPPVEPPPPPPPCEPGPFLVFFDWDQSDIRPDAASVLDAVAAQYQTGRCPTSVMLAGHADRSGSATYNVGLSERRNASVRAYLASRGVPDGSMSSEAFGEGRPLVDTADGVREQQNRRVEITYGPGM
jgi:OmpA-OmpF porin, OOP family